jgi:hypothetical protein
MVKTEKIFIIDDCLANDRYVYTTYTGPNPWGVAKFISGKLRTYFHVSSSGSSHYRINWDTVGENISFYSLWQIKKLLSRNTEMFIEFKVLGKKSKATNQGNFTLTLNARLETTFSGWVHWVKPIWLMYSYLFYHRVRRKMIERCRNNVYNFREEVKKHFNLQTQESVTRATGTYG